MVGGKNKANEFFTVWGCVMQIDWANFTPYMSLGGGVLIGLAAVLLMAFQGRIMGISGIAASVLQSRPDNHWRMSFLIGTLAGSALFAAIVAPVELVMVASLPVLVVAGLLVGIGTALGSGCTSGHGICGISRFSVRSIGATCVFVFTGMVTVFFVA